MKRKYDYLVFNVHFSDKCSRLCAVRKLRYCGSLNEVIDYVKSMLMVERVDYITMVTYTEFLDYSLKVEYYSRFGYAKDISCV